MESTYKTLLLPKVNWSELPLDLLDLILAQLSIPDRLRFASVCRHWYSAYTSLPSPPLPPQSPWLMFPIHNTNTKNIAKFINLSENNKVYKIPMPPFFNDKTLFIGSSKGWLVTISTETLAMHLLNPITRAYIPLPAIPTIIPYTSFHNNTTLIKAAFFKTGDDDYMVTLLTPYLSLSFTKSGDETWTPLASDEVHSFSDLIQRKGQLYTVNKLGDIHAWNLKGNPLRRPIFIWDRSELRRLCRNHKYLVESITGDLFLIIENIGDLSLFMINRFQVLKVDESRFSLSFVKDIGDQALFIGNNQSLALSTKEYPELSSNSIYFTKATGCGPLSQPDDIGVFNICSGSVSTICSHDLFLYGLPPIWVMPSLF